MRLIFVTTCLMLRSAFSGDAPLIPVQTPFEIECLKSPGGVKILTKAGLKKDLKVVGDLSNSGNCKTALSDSLTFNINSGPDTTLTEDCKSISRNGYLVEVVDPSIDPKLVSNEVYLLVCTPDDNGDLESVENSVAILPTGMVLPGLQIGFYTKAPDTNFKSALKGITSSTLGQQIYMVIFNDRKSDHMTYMVIPKTCTAHPEGDPSTTLPLLNDKLKTTCETPHNLMDKFTVKKTIETDMAYTTVQTFQFRDHMEKGVEIQCQVYLCSDKKTGRTNYCEIKNDVSNRCINTPTDYMTGKRRRRETSDTNVMESTARTSTVKGVLYVKENLLSGISSGRVNFPAALTLCLALVSSAILKYLF